MPCASIRSKDNAGAGVLRETVHSDDITEPAHDSVPGRADPLVLAARAQSRYPRGRNSLIFEAFLGKQNRPLLRPRARMNGEHGGKS